MNRVIDVHTKYSDNIKRGLLSLKNAEERYIKGAIWSLRVRDTVFTLYKSGKLLIQGKDLESVKSIVHDYIEPFTKKYLSKNYEWYIGIDESGKGDTFGGVVVCGVLIREDPDKALKGFNVRDSKSISDMEIENTLSSLSSYLRNKKIEFKCVNIIAWEYNKLIEKYGNVNSVLISSYRKIVRELTKDISGEGIIIADQFVDRERIKKTLEDIHKGVDILVEPGAERYKVVALASMLARYKFIKQIEKISVEIGKKIPLGSSASEIKDIIEEIISRDINLSRVAKLHFKNVKRIVEG